MNPLASGLNPMNPLASGNPLGNNPLGAGIIKQ
jgi:TBC1 domain family member 13